MARIAATEEAEGIRDEDVGSLDEQENPVVGTITNPQRILRTFRKRVNQNRVRTLSPTRLKVNMSRRPRKCMIPSTQSIHSTTHNLLIFQVRTVMWYQQWA